MNFLASRLARVKPSITMAVSAAASARAAAGEDMVILTAGEPDFDTPDHIQQAALEAMRAGKTRYGPSPGFPAFREAIAAKFKRDNGLEYGSQRVTVGVGAKQLIYNSFVATLEAGDEVIIPTPCWVSYADIVQLCGGEPRPIECPRSSGYRLAAEQLAAAITPKTKWLMLNSPSNPSGACYSAADYRALGEVLAEHNHVWVMSDEIYEHIVFDDSGGFVSFAEAVPRLFERTLTINGLSKAYCMTGWRVGFAGGPSVLIEALNKVQSQSTSMANSIAQYAGIAALEGSHDFMKAHVEAYQHRRDLCLSWLASIPGLQADKPQGAFYLYVDCSDWIGRTTPGGKSLDDDNAVAQYLSDDDNLVFVAGSGFGLSPAFRISFAAAEDKLKEGFRRLKNAADSLY